MQPLTKADRCDRCRAQAYVVTTLHSGHTLSWCAHHYVRHFPNMWDLVAHVQDERHLLIEGTINA